MGGGRWGGSSAPDREDAGGGVGWVRDRGEDAARRALRAEGGHKSTVGGGVPSQPLTAALRGGRGARGPRLDDHGRAAGEADAELLLPAAAAARDPQLTPRCTGEPPVLAASLLPALEGHLRAASSVLHVERQDLSAAETRGRAGSQDSHSSPSARRGAETSGHRIRALELMRAREQVQAGPELA